MQRLEVSGAVRPIYGSLGVKRLNEVLCIFSLRSSCRTEVPYTNISGNSSAPRQTPHTWIITLSATYMTTFTVSGVEASVYDIPIFLH